VEALEAKKPTDYAPTLAECTPPVGAALPGEGCWLT